MPCFLFGKWSATPIRAVVVTLMFGLMFGCKLLPEKTSDTAAKFEEFDGNMVLLFIDGVRWQEMRGAADRRIADHPDYQSVGTFPEAEFHRKIMTKFWERHAKKGLIFGLDPHKNALMENLNRSGFTKPIFESLFLGKSVLCTRNEDCPRIPEPSFLERIKRKRGLAKKRIGVFFYEEESFFTDVFENQEGSIYWETSDNAGKNHDKNTFELAMRRLDTKPRLTVIYLAMTDWSGHAKNYRLYVDLMKNYDDYIDILFRKLETMGEYGEKTAVLVTTDHGRGASPDNFHGHALAEVKNVWMFVAGPHIKSAPESNGVANFDHHIDHGIVRPLVETFMGVKPLFPGVQYTRLLDDVVFEW
ncbi:MAG: LTA synthase family protein [Proteobacteria bacterium]|nr:LTA synthase family protein [Pseudomonadota bacterium]